MFQKDAKILYLDRIGYDHWVSVLAHVFEPVRSTVLLEKESFPVREATCDAPATLE